jgi:acetyl-CoA C-acetyltransferase/3-oxo-5,6-didehydrosuberyl-CoA/3-oxoadipyl-CoA thiolase
VSEAVIVDAVRTPIGKHGGALSSVRPDDLAAAVIRGLVERSGVDPGEVDDVILGCANQSGEDNRNVARMSALLAGFPVEVPGQTVNRLCGSGLQAIISASQAIRAGEGDCFIAGGVESMSRAPWVMLKPRESFPRTAPESADTTLGWRFTNPRMPEAWTISLGETAENVAAQCNVSREDQDAFAFESQQRTARAMAEGRFEREIVPVAVRDRRGDSTVVDRDEHPRPDATLAKLRGMKPAFRAEGGTVTAGSSSGINDGASAVLIMDADVAEARGFRPLARIVVSAVAGVSPDVMGLGPVPAIRKALDRAGLSIDDIDLVELNEAFAAQAIACVRELGIDPARVNVNGGAIALGHPLGASGARIITTLVHEMVRREARYGLAAMCIGVGQGIATILERIP